MDTADTWQRRSSHTTNPKAARADQCLWRPTAVRPNALRRAGDQAFARAEAALVELDAFKRSAGAHRFPTEVAAWRARGTKSSRSGRGGGIAERPTEAAPHKDDAIQISAFARHFASCPKCSAPNGSVPARSICSKNAISSAVA